MAEGRCPIRATTRNCGRLLAGLFLVLVWATGVCAEVPYGVEVVGVEDDSLRALLEGSSRLVELRERPPPSRAALRRRMEEDAERLRQVLRAYGHFDGTIEARLEGEAPPLSVRLQVAPGPRYTLGEVAVRAAAAADVPDLAPALLSEEGLGLEEGASYRSGDVLDAERELLQRLAANGYPFAGIASRRVVADRAAKRVRVGFDVDPGPLARFGPVSVEGNERLDTGFVRRRLTWREGEVFDRRKLDAMRALLLETGLFDTVTVRAAERLGPGQRLPVTIELSERARRSIGGGAAYSTAEGPSVNVFWEHRNLFGEAERLRVDGYASGLGYGLSAEARKPGVPTLRDDAVLTFELAEESPEAFTAERLTLGGRIERRFSEIWTGSAGVSIEQSRVEQRGETESFTLLGMPLTLKRDATDSLLDPTEGLRSEAAVTPYLGIAADSPSFLVGRLTQTIYVPLREDRRLVLAGRGGLGSIVGAGRSEIPAHKRLYAGGGGSVRGYEFQSVGPLDENGDPIGGRSLLTLGAELRIRIGENYGVVPFIEAGNVYEDSFPDFSEPLFWAVGLGFRYFTAIGPVRLDVAVPLDRREDVDDAYQFYISIGQAF